MEIIVGIFVAIVLFLLGSMTQAYKKLLSTLVNGFLKALKIVKKEKTKSKKIKVDEKFKESYSNIDTIVDNKLGLKKHSVISLMGLIVTLLALFLIIFNLNILTNYAISSLIAKTLKLEQTYTNTMYTALTFGLLSFGLTDLLKSWSESKEYRETLKREKQKEDVLKNLSSNELLEIAKKKAVQETSKIIKTKINLQ